MIPMPVGLSKYLEHRVVSYGLQALLNIVCIRIEALTVQIPADHGYQDFLSLCSLDSPHESSEICASQ